MSGIDDRTTVEIYGQTYNVRGDGDPEYLKELARFVDTRMRDIAAEGATLDPVKIAILAALNIADEYARYRKRQDQAFGLWMEKTEEFAERLTATLNEPPKITG